MVESNSMHVLGAPIAFKASPGPARLTLHNLVPTVGLEPTSHKRRILSAMGLPISPRGHYYIQDQLFAERGFTICLLPHQRHTKFIL